MFRSPQARQAFWYPLSPVLYILCCSAVAVMIIMRNPVAAFLGIGIVLLGYPLYWKLSKMQNQAKTLSLAAANK